MDPIQARPVRAVRQAPTTHRASDLASLLQQADRLCAVGGHWRAEPLLAQALALVVAEVGRHHPGTAVHLARLARCRMQAGHLQAALIDLRRLSALTDCRAVTVNPLLADTPHAIEQCEQALRTRKATARLHHALAPMLRRARSQRAVEETHQQERVRLLARRLIGRGRLAAGSRLIVHWLHLLLRNGQAMDAESAADIRDHALALWGFGEVVHAGHVFGALVKLCQHRPHLRPALQQALADWAGCLAAQGQHRSARETAALASAIDAAPH
jgi:hypothetical protein